MGYQLIREVMRVLGVDPGFGRMGWSVIDGGRKSQELVECGCLETSKNDDLSSRLLAIYQYIDSLVDEYKPEVAAVEELYFFKNQKTVMGVGQARGVIVVALAQKKLGVFHYTPLQVKNTIAGYGRAEKRQVQMMVKTQLKLKSVPKPDDAADACAVALTHIFMS